MLGLGLKIYARLGRVEVGEGYPVRIMGVINLSPESFFRESVRLSEREVLEGVEKMVAEGADIIDVGARSTAPYHTETITVEEEIRRIRNVVKLITESFDTVVSIDTTRPEVAEQAVREGAAVINDVYGFEDERMLGLVKEYGLSAVVGARVTKVPTARNPVEQTVEALRLSLEKAYSSGVETSKLAIDPCIGFYGTRGEYREEDKNSYIHELKDSWNRVDVPWYVRDFMLLTHLDKITRTIRRPVVVGVSRKSFLRIPTSRRKPEDRLYASIAAETYAVLKSASVVRTHNVKETRDAVRVAEWIKLTEEKLKKII